MAEFDFDFCPNTRVAEVIAPEEPTVKDMNGWDYAPTPALPFRRSFKITLEGLRWFFLDNGAIDLVTSPEINAGVLENFYSTHRQYKPFNFDHEYLGTFELRFKSPVSVPKALNNSGGLLEPLELMTIHHNAGY